MPDIEKVIIGVSPDEPVYSFQSVKAGASAGEEVTDRTVPIWQAMLALQSIPDLLSAAILHSSKLMEVSINGDLVQAADGMGFRAFAMGPGGIVEHARLFNPMELSTFFTMAGVFRVASFVVAQKYLADIAKSLDKLERDVEGIKLTLRAQQSSQIKAAFDYLRQAQAAVTSKEATPAIRAVLEHIERDMSSVQFSLEADFRRSLGKPLGVGKWASSEEFSGAVQHRLDELAGLLQEHRLTTMTRIAALRVASTFPGELALKNARAGAIIEAIGRYDKTGIDLGDHMTAEIPNWVGEAEAAKNTAINLALGFATGEIGQLIFSKTKIKGGTPQRDAAIANTKALAISLSSQASAHSAELTRSLHVASCQLDESSGGHRYLIDWGRAGPLRIWKAH